MELKIFGLNVLIFLVVIFQITHSQDSEMEKKCKEEIICEGKGRFQPNEFEKCAIDHLPTEVHNILLKAFAKYTGMEYRADYIHDLTTKLRPAICKKEFDGSKAYDVFNQEVENAFAGTDDEDDGSGGSDDEDDGSVELDDDDKEMYEEFKECMADLIKKCVEK